MSYYPPSLTRTQRPRTVYRPTMAAAILGYLSVHERAHRDRLIAYLTLMYGTTPASVAQTLHALRHSGQIAQTNGAYERVEPQRD